METEFKKESIHRIITSYENMKLTAELTIEQYEGSELVPYILLLNKHGL